MAVKVHCSICDKFIKDVDNYEFQKLTGKEICKDCGKKVGDVYGKLDSMIADFKKELLATQERMGKVTSAFNAAVKKYTETIQSFYTTRSAEIDSRLKDILEGKK